MTPREIARRRLAQQRIAGSKFRTPGEVVGSLGAVQAQDFPGALWAIGLRLPDATESQVEKTISDRTIVRTWPMRGTLHFVAASDVHWMLDLLTPRVIASSAGRMRQFGIDEATIARSRELLTVALQGGRQLSRPEIYALLDSSGVRTAGQRGLQILWRLAHDGLLCLGTRRDKQHTFTLLDEWIPRAKRLGRDEALAELARRYFVGHGPATLQDFSWWSGLRVSDAKAGLQAVDSELSNEPVGDKTYWMSPDVPDMRDTPEGNLLPPFDEFVVGYTDRSAVVDESRTRRPPSAFVVLSAGLFVDGRLVGTWKRTIKKDKVSIGFTPLSRLADAERRTLSPAAKRYGRFLGLAVEIL